MICVVSLIIVILSYSYSQLAWRISWQNVIRYWWWKHTEMLYARVQKQHYCFLCFAFPRRAYRWQHATNTTVKLFQFHAFYLGIDNFLGNSSKISRDHGTVRRMRRIYTMESREIIKRNGNMRVFVYRNFVLCSVCWRMLSRAQAECVSMDKYNLRDEKKKLFYVRFLMRYSARVEGSARSGCLFGMQKTRQNCKVEGEVSSWEFVINSQQRAASWLKKVIRHHDRTKVYTPF